MHPGALAPRVVPFGNLPELCLLCKQMRVLGGFPGVLAHPADLLACVPPTAVLAFEALGRNVASPVRPGEFSTVIHRVFHSEPPHF